MKEYIDLNCDMGESFYEKKVGNDEAIMPYITSCNVACGFHGGDPKTIIKTVELAIKNNVKVGAHPSLYDLEGFGRRRMKINEGELISLLIYQVSSLYGITKYLGTKLHHVKVHGALYNMASEDDQIARLIVNTVSKIDPNLKIYGPSMLKWRIIAEEGGLEYVSEVFSDRNYNDDLTLVDRKNQNAIINNIELEIGGQKIDKQTTQWNQIWADLTTPESKAAGFQCMTGGCSNTKTYGVNQIQVPLNFWFCRNPGLALPLIALQYHEVKLKCVWGSTTGTRKVLCDYIYLDTDERRRFAQVSHEYLIEQIQEQTFGNTTSEKLNFNHPVKELIWVDHV